MAPFPSGVPNKVNTAISPKLRITMAGCVLAFIAITAGFFFVARKKRPIPRDATSPDPNPSAGAQPTSPHAHRCPNHHEPVRHSVPLPTSASGGGCLACASQPTAAGRRGFEVPRSSHGPSTHSLPPYTRHTTPTAALAIQPVCWPRRARPSESTPASPTAASESGTPSSPPPAYITEARGPIASLHRAV